METIFNTARVREIVAEWRRDGERVAFVPTMGNLHEGHIALLARAHEVADRTVVSIFVNPIQFGRGEDYGTYPSTLEADQEKLSRRGLDVLFVPNLGELYPAGTEEDTRVSVPRLSRILCGKFRPDHFSGVATVVTKLFFSVQPDYALFGEKDLQQLMVIRCMVDDLCIPIEIIGQPIVREPDGLAMSSRNSYLSATERAVAPVIYQNLQAAARELTGGNADFRQVEGLCLERLQSVGLKPEYFSIRRTSDLVEADLGERELSILTAVWIGNARLIDNVQVKLDDGG